MFLHSHAAWSDSTCCRFILAAGFLCLRWPDNMPCLLHHTIPGRSSSAVARSGSKFVHFFRVMPENDELRPSLLMVDAATPVKQWAFFQYSQETHPHHPPANRLSKQMGDVEAPRLCGRRTTGTGCGDRRPAQACWILGRADRAGRPRPFLPACTPLFRRGS